MFNLSIKLTVSILCSTKGSVSLSFYSHFPFKKIRTMLQRY